MLKFPGLILPDELDMRALGGSPRHKINGKPYPYDYYMNLSEFRVIWDTGIIYVPALFIHDRSSIPRFAEDVSLIRKDGPHQRGSLAHDWVFANKGVPGCETFDLANDLLIECMMLENAHEFDMALVGAAVRSPFGQMAWDD